jgi:[histone H3]-trimethyl-L-lysine4 demethylase
MQFPRVDEICGFNTPWLYIGMKYSTFCWHYEDLMTFSINYAHWGKPKVWYCVPESDRIKFDEVVKEKLGEIMTKDPNLLLDIVTMISPTYLASKNIKVFKTL